MRAARTAIVGAAIFATAAGGPAPPEPPLIPRPCAATRGDGLLAVRGLRAADPRLEPLAEVLGGEIFLLTGVRLPAWKGEAGPGEIQLAWDPRLEGEAYRLEIGERAVVRGGTYGAVAAGTVTLLQAVRDGKGRVELPRMSVENAPAYPYRGLLVDVARQWHPVETLRELVLLCRLYKINFLQLHLTDNESFTFPSRAFPALPTVEKGVRRHYTREELEDLVRFADARGVTLVPELETPGHAGRLRGQPPFGLKGLSVVNMASEETYRAMDALAGESVPSPSGLKDWWGIPGTGPSPGRSG